MPPSRVKIHGSVHERWMQRCLDLAVNGAGAASPNPMVGAVLVGPGGQAVGEGWHARYGGSHAERQAIADAERHVGQEVLREATLYVNLEPCNHHGKQPPCTDLILEKGIPRLVVGMVDPFPAVAGGGIARLREHGVEVTVGVLEPACWRLNEAFVHHVATGRPLVTLKIAQTLDGRIATATGDSRWVSGPEARTLVHRWRARLDGVLVGSGTARTDDPALTVRHVDGRQPVRVVLDRTGRLPADLRLFADDWAAQTTAVVGPAADPVYAEALAEAGGRVLTVPELESHLDLGALLDHLGRDGGSGRHPMQSLLVEAGPGLATALIRRDLVDRFYLFIAPKLVGDGIPVLGALGIEQMSEALRFAEFAWEPVGGDVLFRGYRHTFQARSRER